MVINAQLFASHLNSFILASFRGRGLHNKYLMRKSDYLLLFLSICLFLFIATVVDSSLRQDRAVAVLKQRADMVQEYELTDLALFTEARYTRHITQADLHSAFQDHPMSFEHFPSGSLLLPPQVSSQ
jgi:uncharacterized membrane protein